MGRRSPLTEEQVAELVALATTIYNAKRKLKRRCSEWGITLNSGSRYRRMKPKLFKVPHETSEGGNESATVSQ